ncbi:hypothetical protein ES703_31045 [subsurface metagenome]
MMNVMGKYDILLGDMKDTRTLERLKSSGKFGKILQEQIENAQNLHSQDKEDEKLLDVCYDMEALFIGNMLTAMRKTVDESDFFGKSIVKDIFRDMLYDEYAKVMARTDQLGLGRQIYNQLRVQKNI